MKIIFSHGGPVLVNVEDFLTLIGLSPIWRLDRDGYPVTSIKGKNVYLHRVVAERMGLKGRIDHDDQNLLNGQRSNLRVATNSQNMANRGPCANNQSGYKGVYWEGHRWKAQIMFNYKNKSIGRFDTAEEAARAYDQAALELFGEFACLNFPRSDYGR